MLNNIDGLYLPIDTHFIPSPQKEEAITVKEFINLLKDEEDYFKGEQHKTRLMITRLRKIFYDIYNWNSELITKTDSIEGRYAVKLINDTDTEYPTKSSGGVKRNFKLSKPVPKKRVVVVKKGDWMNPNAGSIPKIYANRNQEVILESGSYCDLGNVLAGMDAFNNFAPLTSLPNNLLWLRFLFPKVKSNMDVVTWLGEISSSSGEFLFEYLRNKQMLNADEKQNIINNFASGSAILGDIDSYVICETYNTIAVDGMRVSEIFEDYYYEGGKGNYNRKRRYSYFSKLIGLEAWSGSKFSNEDEWLKYQKRQLLHNSAFYVLSQSALPKSLWLTILIRLGGYKHVMEMELLLEIFVKALKENIKREPD